MTRALPRFVRRVTRRHATIFAEAFIRHVNAAFATEQAIEETDVMQWPDGTLRDHANQDRYRELEQLIIAKMFAQLREPIAEAFRQAANEIFDGERDA
ncbi:MAG TPA: hypothetical protein VNI54_05645 [Thermoanaerobaculia bacterium]|nr:hypothetical protein [Thermoanaerobaculia bacterium]